MALTSQIDAAARTPSRPTGDTRLDLESPLLSMTRRHLDEEQQERRKAAVGVADLVLDHPCELDPDGGITECGHPDHARDATAVAVMLDVFGLVEEPPEPTEKTCTRCKATQPIDQFQHPVERRRTTQCLTCRTKYSRPKGDDQ